MLLLQYTLRKATYKMALQLNIIILFLVIQSIVFLGSSIGFLLNYMDEHLAKKGWMYGFGMSVSIVAIMWLATELLHYKEVIS